MYLTKISFKKTDPFISYKYYSRSLNTSKLCNEILNISNKIRFVAIYDEGNFFHKMRDGLQSYLTQAETENSMAQAVFRWSSRKKMAKKLGGAVFAMAKYGKVNRVTIPVGQAGLILVSMETDVDINKIVDMIIEKRGHFSH